MRDWSVPSICFERGSWQAFSADFHVFSCPGFGGHQKRSNLVENCGPLKRCGGVTGAAERSENCDDVHGDHAKQGERKYGGRYAAPGCAAGIFIPDGISGPVAVVFNAPVGPDDLQPSTAIEASGGQVGNEVAVALRALHPARVSCEALDSNKLTGVLPSQVAGNGQPPDTMGDTFAFLTTSFGVFGNLCRSR